jgi:hypothetical protein
MVTITAPEAARYLVRSLIYTDRLVSGWLRPVVPRLFGFMLPRSLGRCAADIPRCPPGSLLGGFLLVPLG